MTTVSHLSRIASLVVSDHEINFFYETDHGEGALTFGQGPITTLGNLCDGESPQVALVPQRLCPALTTRYAQDRIFSPSVNLDVGADYHDHVADIVSGRRGDLLKIFTLTDRGKRLLDRGDLYQEDVPAPDRKVHRLVLYPSKAAERRLSAAGIAPRPCRILVEHAATFVFHTRRGFTQVRATVHPEQEGPLSALELLEVQIALGRIHRLHWLAVGEAPKSGDKGNTLGTLIRTMVLGREAKTRVSGRVSTYTFVRFETPMHAADADAFALYSARHYSSDYDVVSNLDGIRRVRHFETVGHVFALEGACTIVAPNPGQPNLPDALESFKENTFRQHYLPLMLLSLHEHGFLTDRTSRSLFRLRDSGKPDIAIEKLTALKREALAFRLLFRFPQVSYITMHNCINAALRDVLNLDSMLEKLCQDTDEIEDFFQLRRERRQAEEDRKSIQRQHQCDRRYYFASVVGTGALAGLTAFTIVKEGVAVFSKESGASAYGFWCALAVFVLACVVGYLKRPEDSIYHSEDDSHDEFSMHAALEHMLHKAVE